MMQSVSSLTRKHRCRKCASSMNILIPALPLVSHPPITFGSFSSGRHRSLSAVFHTKTTITLRSHTRFRCNISVINLHTFIRIIDTTDYFEDESSR